MIFNGKFSLSSCSHGQSRNTMLSQAQSTMRLMIPFDADKLGSESYAAVGKMMIVPWGYVFLVL
jgi:hypothetical protein